jgi:hypothetical protein
MNFLPTVLQTHRKIAILPHFLVPQVSIYCLKALGAIVVSCRHFFEVNLFRLILVDKVVFRTLAHKFVHGDLYLSILLICTREDGTTVLRNLGLVKILLSHHQALLKIVFLSNLLLSCPRGLLLENSLVFHCVYSVAQVSMVLFDLNSLLREIDTVV